MRILFLNLFYRPDMAATAQMLADLAEHLAARGHEVEVWCSAGSYDGVERGLPARERLGGVAVRRWPTPRWGRRRLRHRAVEAACFVVGTALGLAFGRRRDVVVTLTSPPLLEVVGVVAAWRGARLVSWQMDVFPEIAEVEAIVRPGGRIARAWRGVAGWALRRAARTVALGPAMRDVLVDARGLASERTAAIANWTDDEAIVPSAAAAAAFRARHGIASDRVVVLYSGNMGRLHPIAPFADAIRLLARRGTSGRFLFLFVGGGRRRGEVAPLVEELGGDVVRVLPYLPRKELRESLAAADVHLLALKREASRYLVPSKVYGMLASGRPILALGGGGEVDRILAESGAGWLVDDPEPEPIARALLAIAGDPADGDRRGAAGRAWLEAHARRAASLAAWEALLVEVAAARKDSS